MGVAACRLRIPSRLWASEARVTAEFVDVCFETVKKSKDCQTKQQTKRHASVGVHFLNSMTEGGEGEVIFGGREREDER